MRASLKVFDPGLLLLQADWPAPPGVVCACTTRQTGVSEPPWDSLNLGDHVADAPASVQENRRRLQHHVQQQGAGQLVYLRQVHGVEVVEPLAGETHWEADGAISQDPGVCLIMLVADCLPILLTDRAGRTVAALHAGWRGLAGQAGGNVVSQALAAFAERGHGASDLLAWLGPCIGPQAFEVGDEVRQAFVARLGAQAAACFQAAPPGVDAKGRVLPKWWADLAGLARGHLVRAGVGGVYGNDSSPAWCTVSQADLFFSHRRDTGRLGASARFGAFIGLRR